MLASLIDGSASYFEIISGTEHCRDKSSGRFHQSVPSVACNHTRACFASEDIFNNDIIQNMTAIFFFNSYFHIQRHNNVCFFSLYCKDASSSSCLLSTLVFGHHRQWWHHQDVHARLVYGSCFRLERGERGEGYSVGCNVQPHFYMPLNPTHWSFLKGLTLKEFFNHGRIKTILLKYPAYITFFLKDHWQKMCVYRLMYRYWILFPPHIGVGPEKLHVGPYIYWPLTVWRLILDSQIHLVHYMLI